MSTLSTQNILMVVTSHDHIDAEHPTGVWLEEFAIPYNEFVAAGYDITVASPLGGKVPVDPNSEPKPAEAATMERARQALRDAHKLDEVDADTFDAIFIPGGHGPMFDFPANTTLQQLINTFYQQGKVIASVCHGPAALVGVRTADGTPLVAGKTITAFTDAEERSVKLDKLVPFLLETRLRELGSNFVTQPAGTDHVERDGLLITGQNPQSSENTAQAVINALKH